MKKRIFYILGGLILVMGIILAIIDRHYCIFFPASRMPVSTMTKPETRLQLVVNPPLLQNFVKKHFLKTTTIPEWAVPLALPYEAAFIVNPDPVLGNIKMALTVNTQRLTPIINQQVNNVKLSGPLATWFKDPVQQMSRSELIREGSIPLDRKISGMVKSVWKSTEVKEPLKAEGQHAVELLADFRDGVGWSAILSILGQIPQTETLDASFLFAPDKAVILNAIGTVTLQGDLDDTGALIVHAEIQCAPDTPQEMVNNLSMILELGIGQLRNTLSKNAMEIEGKPTPDKLTIRGDFKITNVETILDRML